MILNTTVLDAVVNCLVAKATTARCVNGYKNRVKAPKMRVAKRKN